MTLTLILIQVQNANIVEEELPACVEHCWECLYATGANLSKIMTKQGLFGTSD